MEEFRVTLSNNISSTPGRISAYKVRRGEASYANTATAAAFVPRAEIREIIKLLEPELFF